MSQKQTKSNPLLLDICIPVYELQVGMFVSNVDCGWLNTPFSVDGVLLKDTAEIDTFSKLTEYVTISPSRSKDSVLKSYLEQKFGAEQYSIGYEDINTLSGITRVAPPEAPQISESLMYSWEDSGTPSETKGAKIKFASLAQLSRALIGSRLFRKEKDDPPPEEESRGRDNPPYVPSDLRLVTYSEPEFAWSALPVSIAISKSTLAAIENFMTSLVSHRVADVDKLKRAAKVMAEHIAVYPSVMMWAAKIQKSNNKLYQRSLETSIYMTALGRHLGFSQELLADMALTGILLDLGKTKLNVSLLEKAGAYNEQETRTARSHVELGINMLQGSGELSSVVMRAIAEHHEWIDGSGYPKGLKNSEISVYGKMASIADAYAAMINPRPYAALMAPHEAIKQLFAGADRQWFAPLVEQFVQAIGVFPVGAIVELNTGHVAIVVQHNPLRRLEPKILIVTHGNKKPRKPPLQLDLLKHNARRSEKSRKQLRIRKGLPDGAYGINVRDYYSLP